MSLHKMNEEQISLEREQQVIQNAAKVTKRLDGDEVVIEIRVPAYIYSDIKEWHPSEIVSVGTESTFQ